MAQRPDERLEWATNTFFELRDLGTGDGELAYANKFAVPEQVQKSGFKVRQDWYRPFINFMFNNIFRFIAHLDDRYSVGDTHTTTSAGECYSYKHSLRWCMGVSGDRGFSWRG